MRIEQNLLLQRKHHHMNGHHTNNGNGMYTNNINNNNNASVANNANNIIKRSQQGKEVGQDIPSSRISEIQETENEEKPSFLNPELQRELNRILAEADDSEGKLSHDSDSSPSTFSSASSEEEEEEDFFERRWNLEPLFEEDEEDLDEEDGEDEEDQEVGDEELEEDEVHKDDSDDNEEEDEGDSDQENDENEDFCEDENPEKVVDDDNRELKEVCSDSDDATITNEEGCIMHEEIETDERSQRKKVFQASQLLSPVSVAVSVKKKDPFNEDENESTEETVLLLKSAVKNDDSKSAVENEWGNEQIDARPKETGGEHARGETGISTHVEPVLLENCSEQNRLSMNKKQYRKGEHAFAIDAHTSESVSGSLKISHEEKKQQHEHRLYKVGEDEPEFETYTNAVEHGEDDDDEDLDDESDSTGSCSSSSSIENLEELEQRKHVQHGHVEIRLFHEDDVYESCSSASSQSSNCCTDEHAGEERTPENTSKSSNININNSLISRQHKNNIKDARKCADPLVDFKATTSAKVSELLVPGLPGESGTGSSSTTTTSTVSKKSSAGAPSSIKSYALSSAPINSHNLLELGREAANKTTNKSASAGDSSSTKSKTSYNREPGAAPAPNPIIKNNKRNIPTSNSCAPINPPSTLSSPSSTILSKIANSAGSPSSILITSPKSSPESISSILSTSSSSVSSSSSLSKKKRVSFQEQVESKLYFSGDEPSSVASSNSDFSSNTTCSDVEESKDSKDSKDSKKHCISKNPSTNNSNINNNLKNNSQIAPTPTISVSSPATEATSEQYTSLQEEHQELNNHLSSATHLYNYSQFSTADFWANRNVGLVGNNSRAPNYSYIEPIYYSESEQSCPQGHDESYQSYYHQRQKPVISCSTNNFFYYPSDSFALKDRPVDHAQNNSSTYGLPTQPSSKVAHIDSKQSSSNCANSFWKANHLLQQQEGQESTQPEQPNQEEQAKQQIKSEKQTRTSTLTRPTSTTLDNNRRNAEMHQRLAGGEQRLRSVLRKPGVGGVNKKRGERSVTFNESLNLFYEAECSCWIHEDDYARLRQEEQQQQQQHSHQHHHHHHQHHQQFIYEQTHPHYPHSHQNFIYEPPPIEFEDPPTLSPPEGYKDRFFPQEDPSDPDVTRVCPPSPPSARRKVFLKENSTDQLPPPPSSSSGGAQQKGVILNGLDEDDDDEDSRKSNSATGNSGSSNPSKGSRLGGILKGGRLWRSNSAEGKKVTSPPDEPDVVKETRDRISEKDPPERTATVPVGSSSPQSQVQTQEPASSYQSMPTKVSTGTAPLRTSEQIRLAVDSTLRLRTKKTKPECSSLVEKLRWLTSLDDDDPSDSSSQSGFATWPSRDKNGSVSSTSSSKKSDAGTSTNEEFVNSAGIRQPPPIYSSSEAKIKQISYTLEDIDEGLKGSEIELESFITEDGGRIERLKKRYSGEESGDDYGFSRRPSVKGIKPKFSSTNQIFAQYTAMRASGTETPVPVESQYENTRALPPPVSFDQQLSNHIDGARIQQQQQQQQQSSQQQQQQLNYDIQNATGRPPEESRAHFEMIRQSFEHAANFSNFNRPHSWSVSTLPHPHHTHAHSNSISLGSTASPVPPSSVSGGGMQTPNLLTNNFGSTLSVGQPMQQPQNNLSMNPSPINMNNPGAAPGGPMQGNPGGNPSIYGTLPSQAHMAAAAAAAQQNQMAQPIYGTVRRVPNVIGRPLFLHYGALSVEAHPNKIVQPFPRPTKVPETPSPTQQPPPLRYYGPPIRYYNSPPPVPPRSVTTTVSGGMGNPMMQGNGMPPPTNMGNQAITDCQQERGVPEGATDEEPSLKESYSMNV